MLYYIRNIIIILILKTLLKIFQIFILFYIYTIFSSFPKMHRIPLILQEKNKKFENGVLVKKVFKT
jgi:hypothetical protein